VVEQAGLSKEDKGEQKAQKSDGFALFVSLLSFLLKPVFHHQTVVFERVLTSN
jgi:hypothetical protein